MNRLKVIKDMTRPSKYDLNDTQLLDFRYYKKRDNLSGAKSGKVKSKILKSKAKTKKAIQKIQQKNIKMAMYGLY